MQTSAKMRVKTINKQSALCRNELRGLSKLGVRFLGSEDEDSDDSVGSGDEDSDDSGGTGSDSDIEESWYDWKGSPINVRTLRECLSLKYLIKDKHDRYNTIQHTALLRYIPFLVRELQIEPRALRVMDDAARVAVVNFIASKEYDY